MTATLRDSAGAEIRLTNERLAHLLDVHPEIAGNAHLISKTLAAPDLVVQPGRHAEARLYYRRFEVEELGEKYMCVVVQAIPSTPFVLTAYFADRIKEGALLWQKE